MVEEDTWRYGRVKHFLWQCVDHFTISLMLCEMRESCRCNQGINPLIAGAAAR